MSNYTGQGAGGLWHFPHPTSVHGGAGDGVMGPRGRSPPWLGGNDNVPVAKIDPGAVPVLVGE